MGSGKHALVFPRILKTEGRRIVELSILMNNVPGMITNISDVLASHKVNILWGSLHQGEFERAWWCFFADFSDSNLEKVIEELKRIRGVTQVYFRDSKKGGIIFDDVHSAIETGIGEGLLIPKSWLSNAFNLMYNEWGSGGKALVYHLAFRGGLKSYSSLKNLFDVKGERLIDYMLEYLRVTGFIREGEKEVNLEEKKGRIILKGCFECEDFINSSDEPRCHFVRGLLAGFFTSLFSSKCSSKEVKCRGKGDPHCEFIIFKGSDEPNQ